MTAAFAFLCALVGVFAGLLTGNAALTTLATWIALIAFGALLPEKHPVIVVVRKRGGDLDDPFEALPIATAGSFPDEENV